MCSQARGPRRTATQDHGTLWEWIFSLYSVGPVHLPFWDDVCGSIQLYYGAWGNDCLRSKQPIKKPMEGVLRQHLHTV